jgi:broad specificity phosphatase PhoE
MLIRHGATAWSVTGQYTGRTDLPLTSAGEAQCRALRPVLAGHRFGLSLTSPLRRATRTAELAGLRPVIDDDLSEWAYGPFEGKTIDQARHTIDANWSPWAGTQQQMVGGEVADDVGRRADRVISRLNACLSSGVDAVAVAHADVLRILTARWLGLPAVDGRLWGLSSASISVLHRWRGQGLVAQWNFTPYRCALTRPDPVHR